MARKEGSKKIEGATMRQFWLLAEGAMKAEGMMRIDECVKGSSLPLTLINDVLYFPYLYFNFSVIFFKLRNSPYDASYSAVSFDIKKFTYVIKIFATYLT